MLEIDELQLDKECVSLPSLILKAGQDVADYRHEVDSCKTALDVIQSELSLEIRKDPEQFGLEKTTEATITSVITIHPKITMAQKNLAIAKHDLDVANAFANALEAKKRSLQMLVELHSMGYFNEVKPPSRDREAHEMRMKKQIRRRGMKE